MLLVALISLKLLDQGFICNPTCDSWSQQLHFCLYALRIAAVLLLQCKDCTVPLYCQYCPWLKCLRLMLTRKACCQVVMLHVQTCHPPASNDASTVASTYRTQYQYTSLSPRCVASRTKRREFSMVQRESQNSTFFRTSTDTAKYKACTSRGISVLAYEVSTYFAVHA